MATADLTVTEHLAKARREITKPTGPAPYLARGLFAMVFVENPNVPTAGIDKRWRVQYNPAYYAKCAKEGTLVGEVLHECLHNVLRHGQRADLINATDKAHWNACADAELDQRIEALPGFDGSSPTYKLVTDRIRPEALGGSRGMTAEELYRLPRKGNSSHKCHCSGGTGVQGGAEPSPGDAGDEDNGGQGGSGPAGLSEAEGALVCAAIAAAIQERAEAKGRGTLPAWALRWADEFGAPPPVPWGSLVAGKVRYAVAAKRGSHPSYARPARRGLPGGIVLPVHRMPVPRVTVVGDTSGSMRNDDIGKILATVYGGIEALGKILALGCDARAAEAVEVTSLDDLKQALSGGGGTDMRIGIDAALETSPDAIVVVTDCETPWPDDAPEVPVIVVATRRDASSVPTWAEIVFAE